MKLPQTRASGRENVLQSNPPARIPRSAFDRSYRHLTTIDSAYLYPLHVDEVLPGDSINLRPSFFVRMATPVKPFMDGLWFDYQMFYVPTRQVWDNFVKMMGERVDPDDHNDYTTPQMVSPFGGHAVGSLSDYIGIPPLVADISHSTLFHRAYNHIWNTWYRDADLQDTIPISNGDGPDSYLLSPLKKRGKRKDYLTGARPFAQRGAQVTLPLGTSVPVVSNQEQIEYATESDGTRAAESIFSRAEPSLMAGGFQWSATEPTWFGDETGLEADLSAATAASINTIRTAIATQHVLERDARGGGRYWEVVANHFNVYPDHIRLERPELLATGSVPVNANPVPQASPSIKIGSIQTNVGELGAFATAAQVGRGFVKSFQEHGMILVLGSVRAELSYQQGLQRMFSRLTRYDHYWPDFANIGEQAVLSKEIYLDGGAFDDAVWGYQPRYEEYRHRDSLISGQFRSAFPQSLDVWHAAQDFVSRPVLNAAFIEENPPIARLVLSPTDPEFLVDCYYKIKHVRPMPRFATPGMVRF